MGTFGKVKDTLSRSRLSGVYVGNDTYITNPLQRVFPVAHII
ncbi:hypothetical protein C1G86_0429 [Dehalococcoides mccartyi]|uniref:Translation elongation factor G n=1 Tax=Dehalococcoides mccartyi TaxID=61435 RepID=A0A142V9C0_9CHLR|nr:translation elongation factor G [Dehalococcoides mccartyi]AOV99077.1 hypothetical protein DCWBC2_0412 [Dehalococcoides mccartyi]RAL69464.1 hypothetical protein C1G87_0443 [Dehalococcoides mccartyi]RAL70776.1 hypothetical protein C1G86_0429 [Dehalococcoides mccartyi]